MMALLQNAGGFDLVVGINVGGTERERESSTAQKIRSPDSGVRGVGLSVSAEFTLQRSRQQPDITSDFYRFGK